MKLPMIGFETYGGGIWQTWVDRDLGLVGRVIIEENGQYKNVVIDKRVPLFRIPSCAPHLDKRYTKGYNINLETELKAVGMSEEELDEMLHEIVGKDTKIFARDLYLVSCEPPKLLGLEKEYYVSQGLDNLVCTFPSLMALIEQCNDLDENPNVLMGCYFDVEEIGSCNRRGASSVMLKNIQERIVSCFCNSFNLNELIKIGDSKTIVISADVNHASHPNYPLTYEKNHPVYLDGNPVTKVECSQYLLSDNNLLILLKQLAEEVDVKIQVCVKPQDSGEAGSTIGPHIARYTGFNVIDTGVPLLGMHSLREMASSKSVEKFQKLISNIYKKFHENESCLFI